MRANINADVPGSIPASSDTAASEGLRMKLAVLNKVNNKLKIKPLLEFEPGACMDIYLGRGGDGWGSC